MKQNVDSQPQIYEYVNGKTIEQSSCTKVLSLKMYRVNRFICSEADKGRKKVIEYLTTAGIQMF